MAKFERHHIIPLSLGGMDIKENIMMIESKIHSQIHQTLNMPGKNIRFLRKLQNSLNRNYNKIINYQLNLRKKYFRNLPFLPSYITMQHFNKLLEQIAFLLKENEKLKIENLILKTKLDVLNTLLADHGKDR